MNSTEINKAFVWRSAFINGGDKRTVNEMTSC